MTAVLPRLSSFLLGLLAGAMLAIEVALVPYWTSLPPAEFRVWFAAHAPRIGALMFPLGSAAAATAVVAAVFGRRADARRRNWLGTAAGAALVVVAVTMAVNEPANVRFVSDPALGDPETTALLARWGRWHLVRLACGLFGSWAALRALES